MFLKTFLRTKSPGCNIRGFTRLLYRLASLRWYDAIRTAAASLNSSAMSRSLITYSGISFRSVGIPISVGIIDESSTHLFLINFSGLFKYFQSCF